MTFSCEDILQEFVDASQLGARRDFVEGRIVCTAEWWKAYRAKNRERINAQDRARRAANREKYRAACRLRTREWRERERRKVHAFISGLVVKHKLKSSWKVKL